LIPVSAQKNKTRGFIFYYFFCAVSLIFFYSCLPFFAGGYNFFFVRFSCVCSWWWYFLLYTFFSIVFIQFPAVAQRYFLYVSQSIAKMAFTLLYTLQTNVASRFHASVRFTCHGISQIRHWNCLDSKVITLHANSFYNAIFFLEPKIPS